MRRLTAMFVLAFGPVSALATPIALPNNTAVYFQFNNLEEVSATSNLVVPGGYTAGAIGLPAGVTTGSTQNVWGVFNVSSMQFGTPTSPPHTDIAGGLTFFADDGPGGTQGMITGIFYGIQATSATTSTSGYMDLWWHDAGADTTLGSTLAAAASCLAGTSVTCAPDATGVANFTTANGGVFLGRLDFASGISGDPMTFTASTCDPTTVSGGTCHSDSYANADLSTLALAGAPWAAALNGDWFNTTFGTRDVRLSDVFFNSGGEWNLRSNDPGRVFTAETPIPTPEPSTLTLVGLVFAGWAARRRPRTKKTV